MNWFFARFHQLAEKATVALGFSRYVCISYYTRNYLRLYGIDDKKISVIYPGADHGLFSYQAEGADLIRRRLDLNNGFIYLYYGRPGFFKGVEYLLQAVPLISKKIPRAKLLLILSKEPKAKYNQVLSIIKDLKIENSLILLESTDEEELIKYISGSDCVVLPSLTEGFGFACVESCSVGKPLAATNVGAIPEVISGKHVFINPGSAEEICRGVESVYLEKTEFLPQKRFDWDLCVSKHEHLYNNILKWVKI